MFRIALSVALSCCVASSAWAVDVAKQAAELQGAFSNAVKELGSLPDAAAKRAGYDKALAEHQAALTKLAAQAEAEQSTEHAALARLYLQLTRADDAIRHARALIDGGAKDAASFALLVQSLSAGGQASAAADAFGELLQLELNDQTAGSFFASAPAAVVAAYRALSTADQLDAAEKVLDQWQAKLDAFQTEDEGLKSLKQNAARGSQSMRQQLASAKARAALVGQQYVPLAEPTWLNGAPISPGELRGKVVLLDFWAVWCGPCIATFPHLIEWHEKYADKGLVIIGVTKRYHFDWDSETKRPKSVGDLEPAKEDAATLEFAKHHGLKHRLAIMTDGASSQQYAVTGIPQVVVIDQGGIIRMIKVGSGEKNAEQVEAEIRKLLGLPEATASE